MTIIFEGMWGGLSLAPIEGSLAATSENWKRIFHTDTNPLTLKRTIVITHTDGYVKVFNKVFLNYSLYFPRLFAWDLRGNRFFYFNSQIGEAGHTEEKLMTIAKVQVYRGSGQIYTREDQINALWNTISFLPAEIVCKIASYVPKSPWDK